MKNSWIPNVLRMADGDGSGAGGGGAGGGDALKFDIATLPEELRGEPSLSSIKTIPDLAKSFVNAQKMIGTDKIAKPQKNWTDAQKADFYNQLGRPETHDKYTYKIEAPAGVEIDQAKLGETRKFLHSVGLSDAQEGAIMKYYLESIGASHKALSDASVATKTASIAALKQEYGDKFDHNINVAQSVIKKFGGPELMDKLNSTGLGDDPAFIKLFASIGSVLLDDTARGNGSGLIVTDASNALAEINKLKMDMDFQKQLMDRTSGGHKVALERWETLHKQAYPGKK